MNRPTNASRRHEAGFSLMELVIALSVTVLITGLAVSLLASSFHLRAREDRKSDAIADVRHTLSTMTREIGNAGYGLADALPTNGIVAADSNNNSIRILSNSDRFHNGASPDSPASPDEDVIYRFVNDTTSGQRYVVRFDVNSPTNNTTVLVNGIDSFILRYYPQKVVYTTTNCDITNVRDAAGGNVVSEVSPDQATYVVITACAQLPAVGSLGAAGYQPAAIQQLTSDVQMRNATISAY